MIDIRFPHMGINDPRSPVFCRMWNTWNIRENEQRQHIFDWVAEVLRGAPGEALAQVVICCEATPGHLGLGEGVGFADAGLFRRWRGLVGTVWLRAHVLGHVSEPQTELEGDASLAARLRRTAAGHRFCSRAAHELGGNLVVSTRPPASDRYSRHAPLPYGQVDIPEGLALTYRPDGSVGWMRRFAPVNVLAVERFRTTCADMI